MTKRAQSNQVGERIQKLRERAELSARELCRLAAISEGHVALIESGHVRHVGGDTVLKIARVLGTSADWLLSGEGREPSDSAIRSAVAAARSPSDAA